MTGRKEAENVHVLRLAYYILLRKQLWMINPNPRPPIPAWVWILVVFGIILVLQLWFRGTFDGPEQVGIQEAMTLIEDGRVKKITVTGDRLDLTRTNDEIISTFKPTSDRLSETFEFYGISAEDLSSLELVVRDQSNRDTFLSIAITIGPIFAHYLDI